MEMFVFFTIPWILSGQPFLHGTVVGGTEDAVVERYGVQGNALSFQTSLVFHHQFGIDLVQEDIPTFPKPHEAAHCRCVGLRCACLAQLFQTGDNLSHETEISNRTYYLPEGVERAVTKVEDRRREARYKGQAI